MAGTPTPTVAATPTATGRVISRRGVTTPTVPWSARNWRTSAGNLIDAPGSGQYRSATIEGL